MRPPLDLVMLGIAHLLSTRATCVKRQVGCVLTDARGNIIGEGYNGVPAGAPHCIDTPCGGASLPIGSDTCQAVHAELNALIRCRCVDKIDTCYTTVFPCNNCMKTLLNTSCQRIVYEYEHETSEAVRNRWLKSGRKATKIATE